MVVYQVMSAPVMSFKCTGTATLGSGQYVQFPIGELLIGIRLPPQARAA